MTLPQFWTLEAFTERFAMWVERENPSRDVRRVVGAWIVGRYENPYEGVRRNAEIGANYWWGPVPGSEHAGTVVAVTYWIFEDRRLVRCDMISTLNAPI